MASNSLYADIGVGVFATESEGVETGCFLDSCSDFIVTEELQERIIHLVRRAGGGQHVLCTLFKTGIDTLRAIRDVERRLRVKVTGYAGLKDASAITIQSITVKGSMPRIAWFEWGWIRREGFTPQPLMRGMIEYNRFTLRIRGERDRLENALDVLRELERKGYIPNYYGHQRFGAERPYNHELGIILLRKGEEALARELRRLGRRGWWETFFLKGKKNREVLAALELLAGSVQSYVFNKCLTKLLVHQGNRPSKELLLKAGVLPGKDLSKIGSRAWVSKEHYKCVEEETLSLGVNPEEMMVAGKPLRASLRPLFTRLQNLAYKLCPKKNVLGATFKLGSGSYASIVIREIFKKDEEWARKKCAPPVIRVPRSNCCSGGP